MYRYISERETTDVIAHSYQNTVVFSQFQQLDCPILSDTFSIKYVLHGVERYQLNDNHFDVQADEFLLANGSSEGGVFIDSKLPVDGICINIKPESIYEVISSVRQPDISYSDPALGQFFDAHDFLEKKWRSKETQTGKVLQQLGQLIQRNPKSPFEFTEPFFHTLIEAIVQDQTPVFKQLQAIPTVRSVTRKQLLSKVLYAKEYMDSFFALPITVGQAAQQAGISEYHFSRLFRQAFGVSPYQYIMSTRLNHARALLLAGNAVTATALQCGFSDVFSFSRAFKKNLGYSPSEEIDKHHSTR